MKAEDIWVSPYELSSRAGLNSISGRTVHSGALIRVESGFGCVHPWPELGDRSLSEQLASLKSEKPTDLVKRALECTRLDGEAREAGRSLFSGHPIPLSHWLYQDDDDWTDIAALGFRSVKVKIGPDSSSLQLQGTILGQLQKQGLRLRLDANESLSETVFMDWWRSLSGEVREAVQFVEDPIPWHWMNWHRLCGLGIPLAADRPVTRPLNPAPWFIFKPSLNPEATVYPRAMEMSKQIAVTTYMDHPVGQMWAVYGAQRLAEISSEMVGECGLLTHHCFEQNEFSEHIEVDGPVIKTPPGTGLGFDDLLEKLPWKRLI